MNDENKTYECLNCGGKLMGWLLSTGANNNNCKWNYYYECHKCGYQNNLAKVTNDRKCTCA